MNNKTLLWTIVGILVVVGAVYMVVRSPSDGTSTDQNGQQDSAVGRIVFSVTDAAVNMSTISEISMKVNKVEMHGSASGWTTVSSSPKTFDLLSLNASHQSNILADVSVNEGMYDQVRLTVDSIIVKTKAGTTKEAKLPSGELKIDSTTVVDANQTASMNLDFLADKSLHTTGKGEYIFAPVVKTESRSDAEVLVDTSGVVSINGGNVVSNNTVGMDIDGSVKLNFMLDDKQKLNIDANNKIIIDTSGILK